MNENLQSLIAMICITIIISLIIMFNIYEPSFNHILNTLNHNLISQTIAVCTGVFLTYFIQRLFRKKDDKKKREELELKKIHKTYEATAYVCSYIEQLLITAHQVIIPAINEEKNIYRLSKVYLDDPNQFNKIDFSFYGITDASALSADRLINKIPDLHKNQKTAQIIYDIEREIHVLNTANKARTKIIEPFPREQSTREQRYLKLAESGDILRRTTLIMQSANSIIQKSMKILNNLNSIIVEKKSDNKKFEKVELNEKIVSLANDFQQFTKNS